MGTQLPCPKGGGAPPQFSALVYCDQTAGWITMALGMEVGLVQSTLCWMRTQLPSPKQGSEPPIFGPSLLWPNR